MGKQIRARQLFRRCDDNLLQALASFYIEKTDQKRLKIKFCRWQFRRACHVLQCLDPNSALLPEGRE